MNALILGLSWFIPALVALIFIGLKVFDENNQVDFQKMRNTIWKARGGMFILLIVAIAIKIENTVKDIYPVGIKATKWFYQFEGVEHILFLQNHLDQIIVIHSASLFYILGLTFLVVFMPVFFLSRGDTDNFLLFSKALMVNYFFILPGYFLLHVEVTSVYPPAGVQKIMYSHDQYYAILYLINRLSNCFPSGHISISLTITLLVLFKTKLKRLSYFSIIFTIMTGFVIIYLGVHWLIDIPAGFLIGLFAFWSVKEGKFDFLFDPIIEFFEEKTEKCIK